VQASRIDDRLMEIWARHPHRFIVESAPDFLTKAARVLDIIRAELPECCRRSRLSSLSALPLLVARSL